MELLASFLDEKTRNDAAEFFDAAFNPSIAWRHVEKLNPLKETDAHFDEGGNFLVRRLEFTFTRLEEDKKIGRLLAVVRDSTERKELAEEIEKTKTRNREEMEMLQRILHIEPAELADFLAGAKEDVDAINEELRSGGENREERLNAIFRYSHAIKGDSQLLSLDFLAARAEDLETQIQHIRASAAAAKRAIQGEDFLPITLACSQLMDEVQKLDGIAGKWLKLSGGISAQGGGLAKSLQGLVERLAARYAKQAALEMSGIESLSLESGRRRALKDVLVQLVRNSVYHGIETPKERRKAGKKEMGLISITGRREGNQFRIVYRDDGAGINTESVMRKARAAGLVPQGSVLSEAEQYQLLFHPGFSTAGAADDVAGKGMGLSLVRQRLKELGAKLSLKSSWGHFCEFTIAIPLKESETP
jgi:chemotaxis protein histidine kinase CheA